MFFLYDEGSSLLLVSKLTNHQLNAANKCDLTLFITELCYLSLEPLISVSLFINIILTVSKCRYVAIFLFRHFFCTAFHLLHPVRLSYASVQHLPYTYAFRGWTDILPDSMQILTIHYHCWLLYDSNWVHSKPWITATHQGPVSI